MFEPELVAAVVTAAGLMVNSVCQRRKSGGKVLREVRLTVSLKLR